MKIHSLLTFIREIRQLKKDDDSIYFFRGHADAVKFKLEPSIYRSSNLINSEHILFKELVSHNPEEFNRCHSAIEYLVKMQHYSLPTRLLDLTLNPLIALYFAVNEINNKHGEVIVFKIPKKDIKYYDSDTVSVLANIAKCDENFECNSSLPKETFNEDGHIPLLLHQIGFEKPHFQKIIEPNDINRVLCVKVKQDNPRIVNQSGAFLLFGVKNRKDIMADIDSSWLPLKGNDRLFIYKKETIKKDLELMGITTSFVYPEMENYARKLKEMYQ
ncbi:FRG domain-containing protein [Parabacteroides merdae]|uniref:FRG domain-containing protein n=1 Tax=Parabacteroides merdae TaxID=46503 RepID=UPI0022E1BDE5|nr:FRG domain-containing protein [Parabacteroides merdae]